MIDLAIEQFHHEVDFVLFGEGSDFAESFGAVFESDVVWHVVAVAAEDDDAGDAHVRGFGDQRFECFGELVVVILFVVAVVDVGRAVADGADEAVLADSPPLILIKEFDRFQADVFRGFAEFFEFHVAEAPAADGLLEFARFLGGIVFGLRFGLGLCCGCDMRQRNGASGGK